MATRSLRWRGFGVSAEVPESVSRRLRRARDRIASPPPDGVTGPLIVKDVHPSRRASAIPTRGSHHPRAVGTPRAAEATSNVAEDPLLRKVETHPWYHTIELPNGIVTPGADHDRPLVKHYGIPEDLRGKRVLDVASFDGFWAFEFERKGAGRSPRSTSRAAMRSTFPVLSSSSRRPRAWPAILCETASTPRANCSSRLSKQRRQASTTSTHKLGRFDLVHVVISSSTFEIPSTPSSGSSPSRQAWLLSDVFDPRLDEFGQGPGLVRHEGGWEIMTWRKPALTTLVQMVSDAGFSDISVVTTYNLPHRGQPSGPWRGVIRGY